MKNKVLALLTAAAFCTSSAYSQEIATWENFCKSAVTFTFDDGGWEDNGHKYADGVLSNAGLPGTFYVITNNMSNSWGTYKQFVAHGSEIGSHGASHNRNSTGNELQSSKSAIENNIGNGYKCLTIAYPECVNPGQSVLQYYIGGRTCSDTRANSSNLSDFTSIQSDMCGTQGTNDAKTFQNRIEGANGGWMVFLIHGFDKNHSGDYSVTHESAFEGAVDFLKNNKSTYWTCTFRDACMYIQERKNATFKKIAGDNSSETYSLTLSSSLTSNKVCNWDYPLSLRVPMQDGWANIKVTQNDEELEFEEKNGYVYFKAVPNGGDIVVGSGTPAVPDPEFTISVDKADKYCKDSTYKVTWTASGDFNDRTYILNWGTGSSSTDISISSVKASSEWGETEDNPYWTVDKILDDDGSHGGNSRWGSMSGSDEWVEFNLGKTQSVGGITIDECTEYSTITAFEVQYDESGSWKTAYTGKSVGHDFSTTFNPVSTSKMRLFIKSTNDGAGCNINYVKFTGVAGYVIKDGITAAGSVDWKPKSAGTGMLTITSTKNKVLVQTSSMKIENCGDEPCTDCGGPEPNPGASTYFDENGAYFGPECENGKQLSGAFYTGDYTSPFKTYLGKTDEEIQEKLDKMWNHYFKGSDNQKVYYDQGNEAYILDTGNDDVRSEGMSYGMMICVQTNHKTEFDKLWNWAKSHMWHKGDGWDGYFAWQCSKSGSQMDGNCAPDGEMYFMTALLFAAHRWNDSKYMEDAQYILERMWNNNSHSLYNPQHYMITFQPQGGGNNYSDPSYDLPAFVELFTRWSDTNKDKWEKALKGTRDHIYKSSNTKSGLFTDYSNFDGTPYGSQGSNSSRYMYDAMRCAMNFGMDYYLFGADAERDVEMAKRIITHFENDNYKHGRFEWDGTPVGNDGYTLGESGANAVACYALMGDPSYEKAIKNNLNKAWNGSLMTGQWRYYDGLVHYLAMLHLCGSFKIWKPAPTIQEKTVPGNTYNGVTYDKETTIDSFEDCQLYRVTITGETYKSDDINNVEGIAIYPNPARNEFNITCSEDIESVVITSLAGQTVLSSDKSEIQVSLPAGTYIVRVATANGNTYVKKLIIK